MGLGNNIPRAMLVSKPYTGNTTFPADSKRLYFFAVQVTLDGSVEFGGGGGQVPLAELNHIAPFVCPTDSITITTSGTFVVITTQATHDSAV